MKATNRNFVFCKYCYYRNAPYAYNGAGCPFESLKIPRGDYDGCTFGTEYPIFDERGEKNEK